MSIDESILQNKIANVRRNGRGHRIYPKKLKNEIVAYATENRIPLSQLSNPHIS